MGKTSKPLTILVHPSLQMGPGIVELAAKGHTIYSMDHDGYEVAADCDLILGPNCWRMPTHLLKYLDIAIAGARKIRYAENKAVVKQAVSKGTKKPRARKPSAQADARSSTETTPTEGGAQ